MGALVLGGWVPQSLTPPSYNRSLLPTHTHIQNELEQHLETKRCLANLLLEDRHYQGGVPCAVRALCTRCAKSWPLSTTRCSVSSEDWKDVIEWLLQWTGL